jgi:hypothetical protein
VTTSNSNKASDKAMEYSDYARHCLKIVMKIPDQASRVIHREMAAEWFKLADQAAADTPRVHSK